MSTREIDPATLVAAPLGHATGYPDTYDAGLLFPMPRRDARSALGIGEALPFTGVDMWTAYELTWLDPTGRPCVAVATLAFPVSSPTIVESKSMKLYLGSFAQTRFRSASDVRTVIARDLSRAYEASATVELAGPEAFGRMRLAPLDGESLDELGVENPVYDVDASCLRVDDASVEETLVTDLFRSVCPVTEQPDIASVQIRYRGPRVDHAGLLRYLVSYRCHPGFHEHCVERIFMDLHTRCRPEALTVYARFMRRGGIDINPFRTNAGIDPPPNVRTERQ